MTGRAAPHAPFRGGPATTFGRPRPRPRPACGVPWLPHDLTYARLYPCGWRCDRHSPWALAGRPRPGTVRLAPTPDTTPSRSTDA
jgi:hypothetical protein